MRTSELIAALAETGHAPVRPRPAGPWLAAGALVGAIVAFVLLVLWLGVSPIASVLAARWFWMKAAYSLALALAGWMLAARLARPGAAGAPAGVIIALLAAGLMAIMAVHAAMTAPAGQGTAIWLGSTWRWCPWRILALAVPLYAAIILVLRRLAPTRLAVSGAAAGLLAGGLAAAIYGLYCRETAAPFVAVWYSLGVAAAAALGAAMGPRFLRW